MAKAGKKKVANLNHGGPIPHGKQWASNKRTRGKAKNLAKLTSK